MFLHEKYESIVLAWKKGDFAWCLRLAPQRLSLMQFPLCPSFHEQSSKLHLSNSKQTPKHKNCWAHYTFYISYLTQQKNWPYKMTCEKERRKKENDPNDTKVPNLRVWQIQKIQFSRQKSIVVLWPFFGTKIELQNFKLIGKSVNCLIFSPKIQNYSLEKNLNFRAKNGQHFPVNYWRKNWTILIENPWNFSFLHLRKELNFRAKNGRNMSGVKIETFKVSLLDFQWKNSKILPE